MSSVVIEEFKAISSNSLRGFARVRLPSGMIVHDVAIHMGTDGPWAGAPSKASIGRDGVRIKRDGKPVFAPVVSFASREIRDRFSAAIIEALRASHPEALA